jgi:hypothetical protein
MGLSGEGDIVHVARGLPDAVGIHERGGQVGIQPERGDVVLPRVEDARGGPVVGDALDDDGRGDEGIVGAERTRAVPGRAMHGEEPPVPALLSHRYPQLVARRRRDGHAAALGDDVIALDRLRLVLHEVFGPVDAPRFLVGDGKVDQGAARLPAAGGEPPRRDGHGGGEVQHVDGATAPDDAVHQLAREGIALPARRADGHYVGVAHEKQRGRLLVAALDPRDQAHAAGGGGVALAGEP